MADTSPQIAALKWVQEIGLESRFPGVAFETGEVELTWGGTARMTAVSEAALVCGYVTTTTPATSSNRRGTAKFLRLRADALYLTNLRLPFTAFIAFTEIEMQKQMLEEQLAGRFPGNIELIHVKLPPEHQAAVAGARKLASQETSPRENGTGEVQ